jgi:iron(III) transport system permease protein
MATDTSVRPVPEVLPEPDPTTWERALSSSVGRRVLTASFGLRLVLSAVLLVAVGIPLVRLGLGSFRVGGPIEGGPWTFDNYRQVFTAPHAMKTLRNTLVFAVGQTVAPLIIGTVLAWLVSRTDIPMRRTWEYLTISLYFVPLLASGTAWVILLGPQNGIINILIRDVTPWNGISVYSMTGMIFVQSLYQVPLVYLVTGASFRAIGSDLEDAARIGGSSPWRTFRDVTLGVSRPSVLSAGLLCFILGLGSLEIPLLFGFSANINVYTSQIYQALRTRFPPEYGLASAFSMLLLVVGAVLLFVYLRITRHSSRYVAVSGRTGRAIPLRLGRSRPFATAGCAVFFFCTLVVPFGAVVWGSLVPFIATPSRKLWSNRSFDNYRTVFHNPIMGTTLKNSLILSVGSGIAVVILGALVAYVAIRIGGRWTKVLEYGATLPITIPSIVLATALLFTFIQLQIPFVGSLYGTRWLMALAYVASFLPVAVRQVSGAIVQISEDLEHASRLSGAGQIRTLVNIVLPLLIPAMFGGFLLAFITYMREFVTSVLLYQPGKEVISVVMYNYYSNGQLPVVAAISVILSVLVFLVIWISGRVFKLNVSL